MSMIATAVKHLMAAGVTGDALLSAIAEMEAHIRAEPKPRSSGAKRTAEWRERQRHQASQPVTCDESDACNASDVSPSLSLLPNENISNPTTHTHPERDTPPARKGHRFPADFACPTWADPDVWADLLKNRKTKHLTNTATAHRKFVNAVEAMVDDAWPPGRLLEAIVARGWGGAHDPRETHNERPVQLSQHGTPRQRLPAYDRGVDHRDGFERALDDRIFGESTAAVG